MFVEILLLINYKYLIYIIISFLLCLFMNIFIKLIICDEVIKLIGKLKKMYLINNWIRNLEVCWFGWLL